MPTLRELLVNAGLSTPKLAEQLGVSRSICHEWVTGAKKPRDDKLRGLADAFGVTIPKVRDAIAATAKVKDRGGKP